MGLDRCLVLYTEHGATLTGIGRDHLLVELLEESIILFKSVDQVCPIHWLESLQPKCILEKNVM